MNAPDKPKAGSHDGGNRYKALVEQLPVGVYRTTLDGLIVAAHGVLARMLGYKQPSARTRFALLIKALPELHKEFPALSVALAGFEADGFVLEILSNSKPVSANVLDQVFVHVEVSQYSA